MVGRGIAFGSFPGIGRGVGVGSSRNAVRSSRVKTALSGRAAAFLALIGRRRADRLRLPTSLSPGGEGSTSMAQRGGDDELAERLGGISLESVSAGEAKSSVGPAGLIHKVRDVTPPSYLRLLFGRSVEYTRPKLAYFRDGGGTSTYSQDSDAIKLFVGQIPKHMEEEDLRPVFEEFGEIFDLAVIRDKISGLHRGEGVGCCVPVRRRDGGCLGGCTSTRLRFLSFAFVLRSALSFEQRSCFCIFVRSVACRLYRNLISLYSSH